MNLSRTLSVTLLLLAVVVGVSFLALFLSKRTRSSDDSSGSAPATSDAPSSPEESELKDKLDRKVSEARKLAQDYDKTEEEMRRSILDQHRAAMEDIDRRYQEAVLRLTEHFKPTGAPAVDPDQFKTKDLELVLDVNLPQTVGSYKVGNETVKISRESYPMPGTVKFTHQRMNGFFNLQSVQFGGKTYTVPRREDVVLVTVYALENDPGFVYFMFVCSKNKDPELFENDGDKFVVPPKEVQTFTDEMKEKALKFNRPVPEVLLKPKARPTLPTAADEDEDELGRGPEAPAQAPAPPKSKAVFQLDFNSAFMLGSDELKFKVATEFEYKYVNYFYFVQDQTMRPDVFTVKDQIQHGLPEGGSFNAVSVYAANGVEQTPLMVKFLYQGNDTYYANNGNNQWSQANGQNLEEHLDFLDGHLNNRVVVNVGRRSDYHRNGSGDSKFELTKDVNVYVETDQPALGWNTYRHMLEVGGEGGKVKNFTVSRLVFKDYKYIACPKREVQYIDAFAKSDADTSKAPTGLLIKYADGTHEYYLLVADEYVDKAVCNIGVDDNNLAEKLEEAAKPFVYKPKDSSEQPKPTPPQKPTEVEVVLSRTATYNYFTSIAAPDPQKFPEATFPGFTAYAHVFNELAKVKKYLYKNEEQSGLPTDKAFDGVLVYFHNEDLDGRPKVVCPFTEADGQYKCYVRNSDTNWVLFQDLETLDRTESDYSQKVVELVKEHYKLCKPQPAQS